MAASCTSTRASTDALRVNTSLVRAAAFCLGVVLAALPAISAEAADVSGQSSSAAATKAPIAEDLSGFYVGGHFGYATAGSAFTATQPGRTPNLTGTLDLFRPYDLFMGEGSNFGGFQAGYNTVFKSGLMVGIEADISFPGNMSGTSGLATPSIGAATYSDMVGLSAGWDLHPLESAAFPRRRPKASQSSSWLPLPSLSIRFGLPPGCSDPRRPDRLVTRSWCSCVDPPYGFE
jgi:hypothetical protein